ncbi:glycosyl hydrolase family 18 protein [Laceyella sacchari]|uniref:chitinase n=2 Tax=Laceyella sacchari TaxID=37482 RepID=A0ABY5U3H8_LACSH|nr:glycosyl hydrolase family 18 protein [Laceyella sacchari]UWE04103.1 glycosyl hydrolase family 18 protein [Laceyella sacchari]
MEMNKRRLYALSVVILLLAALLPIGVFAASEWAPHVNYQQGDQVTYQGNVYSCLQSHTSLPGWEPPNVPALWKLVSSGSDDTTAPSAPANLKVTGKSASSVSLSWTASTDNVGVVAYEVYNGANLAGVSNQTQYTVTGLSANTSYTFTVKAKDAAGNRSGASNSVTVTTDSSDDGGGAPAGDKLLIGYWHNFDNGSTTLKLGEVSSKYDVIPVAFAEPSGQAPGHMQFTPYNATPEQFKADIARLKQMGKKVLISIGGANGHIQLHDATAKQNFINSMKNIIQTYGFNGMDIDLEGSSLAVGSGDTDFKHPTTPIIVNMIDAIRSICDSFGSDFMLTMAPETAYVQGGYLSYGGPWGAYLPVIHALRDKLTFIHVQHYNSGSMVGLDGKSYTQGTADFQVAMAEMLLQGFPVGNNPNNVFPGLREDQVAIGLPASPSAASGGYTTPDNIDKALKYLVKGQSYGGAYKLVKTGGYPGFRGVMTWSINWDAASGHAFSNPVRNSLDSLK